MTVSVPKDVLWRPPASFMQRAWWDATVSHVSNYNVSIGLLACGEVDAGVLRQALRMLARRHEPLRSELTVVGSELRQVVLRWVEPDVREVDLSDTAAPTVELERLVVAEAARPFDLARAPLWRTVIARLDERRVAVVVVMHHAVSDAWSTLVVGRDLAGLYESLMVYWAPPLDGLEIHFGDFARWEGGPMSSLEAEAWWKRRFSPAPARPALPVAPGWRDGAAYELEALAFPALPAEAAERLERIARDHDVGVTSAIQAAVAMDLAAYVDGELVIGAARANRDVDGAEQLVGPLFSYLPLRLETRGDPSFAEMLARTRVEGGEAKRRMNPIGRIERAVDSVEPLFDVTVNVMPSRAPVSHGIAGRDGNRIHLTPFGLPVHWVRMPVERVFHGGDLLGYLVRHTTEGISGLIVANGVALPTPTMARLGASFARTLRLVSADPGRRISDVMRETDDLGRASAEEAERSRQRGRNV